MINEPTIAEIGHNNPPSEIELLKEGLADRSEDIRSRADELLDAATRVPAVLDSDAVCARASDFVKQLQAAISATEKLRVAEKAPYLCAERVVDGFFKPITDALGKTKTKVDGLISVYLTKKRDDESRRIAEEKRKADEAAAKALAEAAQAALQAQTQADNAAADLAVQKAQAAVERAAEIVTQPIANPQARGDMAMSSLRGKPDYEIIDRSQIDLEVLRPYLSTDAIDKAIRAAINKGHRTIKGLRIFETFKAVTR